MTWVTRARPKTDRIACPWLIRKFIDPDAQILYVPPEQVLRVAEDLGGISFDAPGATYTHRGGLCTFEVLIQEYHLEGDAALVRLARIVHAADVDEDLDSDPAGLGVALIGIGGLDVEPDDQRLLERASFVYDALYAWCTRDVHPDPTRQTATGQPGGGERGILGEGCRDCYRPVRRRSQSSTVARGDASAVPRRRCSRRCAMDRRYSGMANDGRSRPPPATRMWWANPRSRVVIDTTMTSPTGQALNALVETTRTGRVPLCSPGPAGSRDASQTSPRSGIQTLDRCFLPLATLGEVVAPCLGVHLAQLAHLSGGLLHQCRVLYLARQLIEQCTHRDAANLSGGGEAVPHLDGYLDGGQIGHPKKVPHQGVHSEGRMSATGAGRRLCRWAAAVVGAGNAGTLRGPTMPRPGPTPMLLARSRHASMRSLERYARPGPEALARHFSAADPAARRRRP